MNRDLRERTWDFEIRFIDMINVIWLFYLWIPSPELALSRIRERVKDGGHNVPETDVRRRFSKSLRNLIRRYAHMADHLVLFDNSSATPEVISERHGEEEVDIFEPTAYRIIYGEART